MKENKEKYTLGETATPSGKKIDLVRLVEGVRAMIVISILSLFVSLIAISLAALR